jgi:hypothetical protein
MSAPQNTCQIQQGTAVEGFSIWLEGFDEIVGIELPVFEIESLLLKQLASPVRLLRWAIVRVEQARFLCEGAYLRHS